MRFYTIFNTWIYVATAAICLIRLAIPDDWPVILKYQQWEYALKVFVAVLFAAWGFWVTYR